MFSDERNVYAKLSVGYRNVEGTDRKLSDSVLNTAGKFPTSVVVWSCIYVHGVGDFHVHEGKP